MAITKRNGKYYCRFQINGERHHKLCTGATTLKEAQSIENAFKYKLQQMQNGVIAREKDKTSLAQLYKVYEDYTRLNNKNWKENIGRLKLIKAFWNYKKSIEEIQPDDIEKLKMYLIDLGKSTTTVNRYLEIISKMFNIAIDNSWIDKNPIKKDIKFKTKNYQLRYASEKEEDKLYRYSEGILHDIVFIAFNTGIRAMNLILLQGKNINTEFKMIELTENKGNKHLKIPMNKKVYNYFKDKIFEPEEYVFKLPETGKPYSYFAFNVDWNNLLKKAKINSLRFHDLRHTVGTRLAKQGVPVNVIKELLGHSDIKTTMQYIHCANKQLNEAVELL